MLDGVAGIMGVSLPAYEQTSQALHPMNTLVYADDVAAAALWLGSDAAARATGTR
jgi:hypothetical protein